MPIQVWWITECHKVKCDCEKRFTQTVYMHRCFYVVKMRINSKSEYNIFKIDVQKIK